MRLMKYFIPAILAVLISTEAWAQGGLVRLAPVQSVATTLDADSEEVSINFGNQPVGMGTVGIQITGAYVAEITPECSINGTDWQAIRVTPTNTATAVTSIADDTGIWTGSAAGCRYIRAIMSSRMSGAAVVSLYAVETGGGGGAGGSGGVGGGDFDIATFTTVLGSISLITATNADNLALTLDVLRTASFMYYYDDTNMDLVRGNATDGLLVNLGSNNDVTVTSLAIGGVTGTIFDRANSNPIATQIVDTNGDAITSFGGGTQYTEGDTDASITGTALLFEGAADTLIAAPGTAADGLLVNLGSNNDVTVTGDALSELQDIDDNTDGLEGSVDGIEASLGTINTAVELIDDAIYVIDGDITNEVSKFALVGCWYQSAAATTEDGDGVPFLCDANGRLLVSGTFTADLVDSGMDNITEDAADALRIVQVDGAGATITFTDAYVEDEIAPADPEGPPIMMIRKNTPSTVTEAENDWSTATGNPRAALWVDLDPGGPIGLELASALVVEDAAETAGGSLFSAGAVVRAATSSVPAGSTATAGENATFNVDVAGMLWTRTVDPCSGSAKQFFTFDITGAATTELTGMGLSGASAYWYICAINIVNGAAANNVNLVDDDTDGCASVTASLISTGLAAGDGWNFAANGGLTLGNGMGSVIKAKTANATLCLVTSASSELHGTVAVVAAP